MAAGRIERTENRATFISQIALVLITAACLLPFSGKAFHIDDPLFLWTAKHIQLNPGDPYGFSVNWYGKAERVSEIMKNPPLNCYFIAGVALLTGWTETALHLVFLIPTLAVILGTYRLARNFCKNPFLATLLALFSPALLISATLVMCDVLMLAFWIWAVVFWVEGTENNSKWRLVLAALLIALSALTKYYAISLIPMLAVYSGFKNRKSGWWMAYLLIPILVLVFYHFATSFLYGRGLLSDAAEYATKTREGYGSAIFFNIITGLAFLGGCFPAAFAYSFSLWSKKKLALGAIFFGVLLLILFSMKSIGSFPLVDKGGQIQWLLIFQLAIFVTAGVALAALAVAEAAKHWEADSILLISWIIGTLVFATSVNWTVNVRSILPLIPAASILLIRRIENSCGLPKTKTPKNKKKAPAEQREFSPGKWARWILPIAPVASISFLVMQADYNLAASARSAAAEIRKLYHQDRIFFEGHWGFQYYMEFLNSQAVDFEKTGKINPGDILVIPANNTVNLRSVPEEAASPLPELKFNEGRWLTTMDPSVGAGFYTDLWGPLPYAFGTVTPERYALYRISSSK
jgi:4-amino-4-deoxy-L-arabinose transferase-like glycosyltransferase